jgi:hypothetical protein
MRRLLMPLTVVAVAAMVPVAALASTTGKSHHYTDHMRGAQVQTQGKASIYAYKVTSSDDGAGANVTVSTSTSSTSGKSRAVSYFANGSVRTAGAYKLGGATTSGLVTLTVSGRVTGGTGAFKGARGRYHGAGTYDPKTNTTTLTLTGVITP